MPAILTTATPGRAIAGLAVGQLTMVVPLYISEVSIPDIRGGLVVLQQRASCLPPSPCHYAI
jgi:hypothetical protein